MLFSILSEVLLVPVPAIIEALSPTDSLTAEYSFRRSISVRVGDSPVVPVITNPSLPELIKASASTAASS